MCGAIPLKCGATCAEGAVVKEFIMGLAIGMAGGAVLVANSCKLRQMIKKNQDELMKKAETYIDEQLEKGTTNGTAESGGAKKTEKN